MCIAIVKPPHIDLEEKLLKQCSENNPDGCGFAYVNSEGNLQIEKTMEFEEFLRLYISAMEDNPDSHFLIHFRLATHGKKDVENCHPFWIDENRVMMHNGTIHKCTPSYKDKEETRSDTQIFNDMILKNLPLGWEESCGISELIEDFIGMSKVVVMDSDQNITFFNEQEGHWENDCWFSNYSYYNGTRSLVKTKPNRGIYDPPPYSSHQTNTWSGGGSNFTGNRYYNTDDRSLTSAWPTNGEIFKYIANQRYRLERADVDRYIWRACTTQGDFLSSGKIYSASTNDRAVYNFFKNRCDTSYEFGTLQEEVSTHVEEDRNLPVIVRTHYPCGMCIKNAVHVSDLNAIQITDVNGKKSFSLFCDKCVQDLGIMLCTGKTQEHWSVLRDVPDNEKFQYFDGAKG